MLTIHLALALATDHVVPGDFASVQAAVNASSTGDNIIVISDLDGSIQIDGLVVSIYGIGTNDVVLTSPSSPVLEVLGDATVGLSFLTVDGEDARRVLRVDGSDTTVTGHGVKLRDGYQSDEGGGIRQVNGTVQLTDSIVCGNFADNKDGGGVYVEDNGNFTASRVVFYDNAADSNAKHGGALFIDGDGSLAFTTLLANDGDKGAAVLAKESTITLADSIVANNADVKQGDSEVVWDEGGSGQFIGGNNLYDNNLGGDIRQGTLVDDFFAQPSLVEESPDCAASTFVDFTTSSGANATVAAVGAAGQDDDGDGYGDRIDCAPSNIDIHPDATELPATGSTRTATTSSSASSMATTTASQGPTPATAPSSTATTPSATCFRRASPTATTPTPASEALNQRSPETESIRTATASTTATPTSTTTGTVPTPRPPAAPSIARASGKPLRAPRSTATTSSPT